VIAASTLFALISFLAALRKTKGKGMTAQLLPLLVVFLLPLLWIGAAQNHSAIHARFTYRILAVSLLALIGVGITCIQRVMENKSSNI
jgi:hypothetical protein